MNSCGVKRPSSVLHSCVSITWPNQDVVRGPSSSVEGGMRTVLLRPGEETTRGIDLPLARRGQIEDKAEAAGMRLPQAMSLRRKMFKLQNARRGGAGHAGPGGSHQGAQRFADEVEQRVKSFLSKIQGLEEGIIPASEQTGGHRPDVRFKNPVRINGHEVHWIEVKTYYGCASLTSKKIPVGKIPAQLARYRNAFGPGAVLFGQGFHEELEKRLVSHGTICLDFDERTLSEVTSVLE